MATRHQVRQAVISMLYAHEMGTYTDEFASEYLDEQKIKNEQRAYAMDLIFGVLSRLKELDDEINARLASFKLDELGAMERAILRLGSYEIITKKCDARVAISEAVILASEFGSDSAPKLVNGVLNNVFKGEKIVQPSENSENSELKIPQNSKPKNSENSNSENSAPIERKQNLKSEFSKKVNFSKKAENSKPKKSEFSKKRSQKSSFKKPFNKANKGEK